MQTFDPVWLDTQYNNRARIADHALVFARWAQASARARHEQESHLDLRYGDDAAETLDIFPPTRDDAPVFVFIHGGYWRSLDKRDHSFIAPALTRAGAMVVVPNYGLCPAVGIETIVMQMVRSLAWVHGHAAPYGGNPARIVVAGHSAGGHLAAMLLACRWAEVGRGLPVDLVRQAMSISGLFDLEPLRHTPFLQADLQLTRRSTQRLSPARFPAPAGELHAVVGALESEEFLRQNALIRQAWGKRAVPSCETVPACNHLTIVDDLADPQARLHLLALRLLGLDAHQHEG